MKTITELFVFLIFLSLCLVEFNDASADTIEMSNGQTFTGTLVQTNGDDVLVLTRYAAFDFSKASIKLVKPETSKSTEDSETNKLPDFQKIIQSLCQQTWATSVTPIPATVIDAGILKNVPYSSFRCERDYEINVYGDLDNPAGVEIGVYRKLLSDDSAKSNCVAFIAELLGQASDKKIVPLLDWNKDLLNHDGLTFEITPPTADDSYNGWWISVYSEKALNLARASDEDVKLISFARANAPKTSDDITTWSSDALSQARPAAKATISFMNTSGQLITNAEVVRVIDGVNLIWRTGPTSGGMIRLADLPKDLRERFGYDEAKTKIADDQAAANKTRWQQEANAAAIAQAQSQYGSPADNYPNNANSYTSGDYSSSSGRVYVHGYTRSNGTYVQPYTRSSPHSRY